MNNTTCFFVGGVLDGQSKVFDRSMKYFEVDEPLVNFQLEPGGSYPDPPNRKRFVYRRETWVTNISPFGYENKYTHFFIPDNEKRDFLFIRLMRKYFGDVSIFDILSDV